ncbi:molybdenum cofactor guanylyltransferase MobA [Oxalobacter vibrioformis]|uniref:Molybdenum cofactor guanylyltransferase n=1 Tax=Oxalobacter vibrioformis TaxID=933080 RepID=A0A9E9LXG5_9BURK|nr:molybdenum cofactor guanylyltransferase MobA [Oxalobacter vibrioformis]WAW10046.1 molybdenum cofactor guanylyltransferase MobA [Oxalobacter vibrioformis]
MSKALAKEAVTGLVLAGGRGTRMGSVDKGLQLFRGKPLFIHAAERLAPQVGALLLNANQNIARYAESGLAVVSDEPLTFSGPLAGFATGLKHCKTPYLVTVPCDSPFFPETLVEALGKALLRENADIAIAATGRVTDVTLQPVFCLMRRELLPHLLAFLETGQRKIDAWYGSLHVAHAHFMDETAFHNINTLAELETLEKTTGKKE